MRASIPQVVSLSQTCVPIQENSRQAFPARGQFTPDLWKFDPNKPQQLDWQVGVKHFQNDNYFAKEEGYQEIKNTMFNPLTGQEPVYGNVNYFLNPLQQEQTNAHMSGYQLQKQTRVADNMSPMGVMRFPAYQYPINKPPNVWARVFAH